MTIDLFFQMIATFFLGFFLFWIFQKFRLGGYRKIAQKILSDAQIEVEKIKKVLNEENKQKILDLQKDWEKHFQEKQKLISKEDDRLSQREDRLDARLQFVEKKMAEIEKKEQRLQSSQELLENEKKLLERTQLDYLSQLEKLSGLTSTEAKEIIFLKVTQQAQKDAANFLLKSQKEMQENAEKEACKIIATTINRLALSCSSEQCITTVHLPSDELKGRIIGKEGRNIRVLEQMTGVNFLIDDTPNTVLISGFDPIRKHIAKLSLGELVLDGRIHPTRIEEVVKKHEIAIAKEIRHKGEEASFHTGILNLHTEILTLLGKLHFRYSYGQNILEHSIEVSKIMGIMASELKLDISLAKRIGLLHDMGKALSSEIEGSHALIGKDFALKYGESVAVANGIGCHHQEIEPLTIEASLCSSADAISGGRPGARIESIELYFKRLQKLEEISSSYKGVEKAYAMQAGREIRVIVLPEVIDDKETINLARDIAKRIEHELSYPGKIKVTVIREKRSVDYAI